MRKKIWVIITVLFIAGLFIDELSAMPGFARKYRMSCKTCHHPFPKLKAYGEEFAANGFVIKDQDAPRYFDDTGDDRLSLIRDLPLAIRLEGHLFYNNANAEKIDFASPYLIKLMSGGVLTKNISYYFYFFLGERGEVAGLEDAFLQFSNLFKTGVSLVVGQFQVSDPLFKRELRLTFEDYQVYRERPGFSAINLTYDRGIMLSFGFKSGTDLTLEVLNGSGIDKADARRNFDTDKYKNVFGRLSQDITGFLRLGAFGYYGKEKQMGIINEVKMLGIDASLALSPLEFNVQYVKREDQNAFFLASDPGVYGIQGGFAELVFTPGGDSGTWYGAALYNWVDQDMEVNNYRSASLHLGYLPFRNFRLVGELTYIFTSMYGEYARIGVGLITAF